MVLLDDIRAPSGREQVTRRPAWRARLADGTIRWVFVEERGGQIWHTGSPQYPVDAVNGAAEPAAGFLVGGSTGAVIGGLIGGPPGAVIGGILGALLGVGATGGRR